MMPRPLLLVVLIVALCAADVAHGAPDARYVGMLADGTRIEGNAITGWHVDKGQPQLDGVALFDADRPLRWLRNSEPAVDPAIEDVATFVEMVGGDRLPGQLIGCQPRDIESGGTSGQWVALVQSRLGLESSRRTTSQVPMQVRVDVSAISRIVWREAAQRRLPPGTALCHDGRRLSFRRIRWDKEGVTLLTDDGLRQVPFAEMVELRLPRHNPWDAYYDELARLDLECAGRLIRLETTDGLLATTSPAWLHAEGAEKDPTTWRHVVQPAWSLDPLSVRFATIRAWWSFAPEEVPLSRIEPLRNVQHSILGRGWSWQMDHNVQGGPLQNGRQDYAWGIGVHATSHLWFELPGMVKAFHSQIGLDRTAGNGGCARGLVYCNEPNGTPLFASSHLVGSDDAVDTGDLPLAGPAAGQRSLVLVADAAANDHSVGVDPLDICDTLDWLEPMLLLDAPKLKEEVQKRFRRLLPAWDGWDVRIEGDGRPQFQIAWEENNNRDQRHFLVTAATGKRPVVFSLQRTLSENDDSLAIFLQFSSRSGKPGHLAVRADGRTIATTPIHSAGIAPQRFSVSLEKCRAIKTPLEVVFSPGDDQDRVAWQSLEPGNRPTMRTHWIALSSPQVYSLQGATTKQLSDGSTLVTKPAPAADVYVVTGRTELPKITALRLEAMPSPSLPRGGSGTSSDGSFVLSRFQATLATAGALPATQRPDRAESPDRDRPPLTLADLLEFHPTEGVDLSFVEAAPDRRRQSDSSPNQAITNPDLRKKGWSVAGQALLPHAAVFTLQQPVEAGDRGVTVYLSYLHERQPSAIGRFRLLATADDPPFPVEVVTLPLLSEDAP